MHEPLVSVLLPVYNGGPYLGASIESLLGQTYRNFELIIVNDGSTDDTAQVIERYQDPRIRLLNQENRGLSPSLNRAVAAARGKYLARQDADDLSLPSRLEKQVAFLESHPDHGIVGTWAEIFCGLRGTKRAHLHHCANAPLKFNLIFDNYFVHSSVMVRASLLQRIGPYAAEASRQPEDFELWSRILRSRCCKMANLPEKLVAYREVEGSICRSQPQRIIDGVVRICRENLAAASGRSPEDRNVADLAALRHGVFHQVSRNPDTVALLRLLAELPAWLEDEVGAGELSKEVAMAYLRLLKALLLCRGGRVAAKLLRLFGQKLQVL